MTNSGPKTIIGFKLKGSRKTRDTVHAIMFLVALVFAFLFFGYVQVKLCQADFPKSTWRDCIANKNKHPSRH